MSIGSAIVNQALSRGAGALKKVMGNLPGSALSSSKSAFGGSLTRASSIHLQYPMNVENDIQQGHYIMFFVNTSKAAKVEKDKKAHAAALAEYNDLMKLSAGYYQGDPPKLSASTPSALDSLGSSHGAVITKREATVHMDKAISLYMPPSVKATYSMAYTDTEIGASAQAAVSIAQQARPN